MYYIMALAVHEPKANIVHGMFITRNFIDLQYRSSYGAALGPEWV